MNEEKNEQFPLIANIDTKSWDRVHRINKIRLASRLSVILSIVLSLSMFRNDMKR